MTKATELRELNDDALLQRLTEAREEHFNLRFQNATGQLDNTTRLRDARNCSSVSAKIITNSTMPIAAAYPGRVTAVDLFTGSAPLVSTITVSSDGFHPSDAGYALISERFAKAIADAGIPLR